MVQANAILGLDSYLPHHQHISPIFGNGYNTETRNHYNSSPSSNQVTEDDIFPSLQNSNNSNNSIKKTSPTKKKRGKCNNRETTTNKFGYSDNSKEAGFCTYCRRYFKGLRGLTSHQNHGCPSAPKLAKPKQYVFFFLYFFFCAFLRK